MGISSWWLVSYATSVLSQTCSTVSYSYWISYAKIKTVHCGDAANFAISANFVHAQTKAILLVLWVLICAALAASSAGGGAATLSLGQRELAAAAAALFFFVAFAKALLRAGASGSYTSVEFVNFLIFCALAAVLLLISGNMLCAFFALELLGSATLYAFFVFAGFSPRSEEQSSGQAATSCVYQFILNFFGSVFFYVVAGSLAYYHASSGLHSATSKMAGGFALTAQTLAVAAVLIKLGTGPWVFYKINIYKGITAKASIIYTVVYFSGVLVFAFNAILHTPFSTAGWLGAAGTTLFAASTVVFGANVFQAGSLVLFLSFSSLLNLVLLTLQVL